MRQLRLLMSTSLVALSLFATAQAAELTVVLHGVRAQAGTISVSVVDSQEAWDGKAKRVQGEKAAPNGDVARFTFKDLKPGAYAVMIVHDENGNGQLDTNFIGMPTEGYGFSNNPRVMRKPTWDEARFDLQADQAIDVNLR